MLPLSNHPSLCLFPEGAVFLNNSATLVVADIHLGKSAAFRAKGLPIPEGDMDRDFGRLSALVRKCAARHLVIAGDLFHAPSGITPQLENALASFLSEIGIPLTLVLGNHDVKIPRICTKLTCVTSLAVDEVAIVHDPADACGERLTLAGHWHPVVRIPDGKRTSLRLPCFLLRSQTLILPAFGSFTGGAILKAESGDRVFVALRDEVVELPDALIS